MTFSAGTLDDTDAVPSEATDTGAGADNAADLNVPDVGAGADNAADLNVPDVGAGAAE